MNKIAKRTFSLIAVAAVIFMAAHTYFKIIEVKKIQQRIEKIRDYALEKGINLKQQKNSVYKNSGDTGYLMIECEDQPNTGDEKKSKEYLFDSSFDQELAMSIIKYLSKNNPVFLDKLDKCAFKKEENKITFSANMDGSYSLVEISNGGAYEFNENGTRKRIFIPDEDATTINSILKNSIEITVKKYMTEKTSQPL